MSQGFILIARLGVRKEFLTCDEENWLLLYGIILPFFGSTLQLIFTLSSLSTSDTICDLGGVDELANYGEYSGAPSEQQTYDYAKTILSLMTREKHLDGERPSNASLDWPLRYLPFRGLSTLTHSLIFWTWKIQQFTKTVGLGNIFLIKCPLQLSMCNVFR